MSEFNPLPPPGWQAAWSVLPSREQTWLEVAFAAHPELADDLAELVPGLEVQLGARLLSHLAFRLADGCRPTAAVVAALQDLADDALRGRIEGAKVMEVRL